jgi:hypothetical protein
MLYLKSGTTGSGLPASFSALAVLQQQEQARQKHTTNNLQKHRRTDSSQITKAKCILNGMN